MNYIFGLSKPEHGILAVVIAADNNEALELVKADEVYLECSIAVSMGVAAADFMVLSGSDSDFMPKGVYIFNRLQSATCQP